MQLNLTFRIITDEGGVFQGTFVIAGRLQSMKRPMDDQSKASKGGLPCFEKR